MEHSNPSLDIFLPVLNIGPMEAFKLRQKVINKEEVSSKAVRKVLEPAESPQAVLISHKEITRLHKRAGIKKADEEHMDGLKEHLDGLLPGSWRTWTIDVPTLPTRIDKAGPGLDLSVAGSLKVIRVRNFMKKILTNFYGLEQAPRNVWLKDERVTRPTIARSFVPISNELLRTVDLQVELYSDNTLMPEFTKMGGVQIVPFPPRDQ